MNNSQCVICGKQDLLIFKCNYCHSYYCAEHRLPENHNCSNMPKTGPFHARPFLSSSREQPPINEIPLTHEPFIKNSSGKPSFWKYALFKLLRIIGIFSVLIGAFGGLFALGTNHTEGLMLAIFLFIGGVLLSWYSTFKMHTITVERGVRDANGWDSAIPRRSKWRNKLIFLGVGIIVIFLLLSFFSSLPVTTSDAITGKLYFQTTTSDWDGKSYEIEPYIFSSEEKSNEVWYGTLDVEFISPPLKQSFKITELTFSIYHKLIPSDGKYFTVECRFIDAGGKVQTICTKSATTLKNSRQTTITISFGSSPPQLLPSERLYIIIKKGWVWYWGSSNNPSHIIYKGIPQYKGEPLF